ncbi:MAG TPA: ABC transporter permease [Puia sp.]|nr:ABC transporter permease [Puia sp.]
MSRLQLLLALRQLQRNRGFTLLNILGLTLGLTTFLCITLFVVDEFRYDRYNRNADRIFRVNSDMKLTDHISYMADAAPPVAATLRNNYPEVQTAVRLFPQGGHRFMKGAQPIREDRLVFCDPAIFDVFTLPMIAGNPATALQTPRALVITEAAARKYFDNTNVVGRSLRDIDDTITYTVTGVIRDMPARSSFHYDLFATTRGTWLDRPNSFYAMFPMSTFILLKPGANSNTLQSKLSTFMETWDPHYNPKDSSFYLRLSLMPLTDIHLRSNRTDELEPNGSMQTTYIFSAIAAFVLLLAAINFMNLSTARSTARAREVGVRKVLGSARSALVRQFLTESLIITFIATALALGLTALLLPFFNRLAAKSLVLDRQTLAWLLPALALIVAVVGFLAGVWPAFFLSAFRPADVLKGQPTTGLKGSALRNTLVVFQFSVSLFLIVGTGMVYRQLKFIRDKDLGFDRSRILVVNNVSHLPDPITLKKEALRLPEVTDASLSGFLPTNDHRWHNYGLLQGSTGNSIETQFWLVDADYVPTLQMKIVSGRNLSAQFGTDSTAVVINETAARVYGITDEPLDKTIAFHYTGGLVPFHVVGVVQDFNFASLRDNVTPLAMVINRMESPDNLILRVRSGHLAATIDRIRSGWSALAPHEPFTYSFMDADFDALYRSEQRMGKISILFSALAIAIACLGLFGLAAYAADRRVKEIGIRKVLGATAPNIITLLSKDFLKLIVVAMLITTPIAWFVLGKWLNNFAYRTTVSGWIFIAAGVLVALIALATTFFQSLRAAVRNPVDTLRNE